MTSDDAERDARLAAADEVEARLRARAAQLDDEAETGTETTLDDGGLHHFWSWWSKLRDADRPNLSDPAAFLAAVEQFEHEEGAP